MSNSSGVDFAHLTQGTRLAGWMEKETQMSIERHIEHVKSRLRKGVFISEASVSQGIVLPTLQALGWPVFDPTIVFPEFSVEGRRVDFALCHPANKPVIFIEVKKVGASEGADQQLFSYAFHLGVPMAILTDGQEWSFYLPGEQGPYEERRVYKLDLLERITEEAGKRFRRYLAYDRVCTGDALSAARSDYKSLSRDREIHATFPKAWRALLEEQDSLLLDLLAEKVEERCGYKPDLDRCSQFLEEIAKGVEPAEPERRTQVLNHYNQRVSRKASDPFRFQLGRDIHEAGAAREVMITVFQFLAKEDAGFLERFAARKHGKKRRYLAQKKAALYPDRPDLAREYSVEIVKGWWMGTNYGRKDMQKIIDLGLEVASPAVRKKVKVNLIQ